MNDVQVGRDNAGVHPVDRGQNLLVHPPVKPQLRQVAKQLDVVNRFQADPSLLFLQGTQAMHLHDIRNDVRIILMLDKMSQPVAALEGDGVVRIHPEDPIARRVASDSLRAAEKSSHHGK